MINRRKYSIANFKMNKNKTETNNYINELVKLSGFNKKQSIKMVVCPSSISMIQNNSIHIGVQNINSNESGAYTGEISAEMIKDTGAEYVILGHSERREHFKETNQEINKKGTKTKKEK